MEAGGQTTAEKEDTTYLEPISNSMLEPEEEGDRVRSESNKTKEGRLLLAVFHPKSMLKAANLPHGYSRKKKKWLSFS
jgi:hypothetical protein